LLPPAVQTGLPLPHAMFAAWHELASLQSAPALHATQLPLSHTPASSHGVPFVMEPCTTHTGPPSHSRNPDWHDDGEHLPPGVHAAASPVPLSLGPPASPVTTSMPTV
jgi:hypothetical protein